MKTKNVALTFLLASFSLATLNSCKKNAGEVSVDENETVSVKNGMLNFKSQQEFDQTISKFHKLPLKEVDGIISHYGIKSLALDTAEGKQPKVYVADPVFARLLNSDASVIIGGKIFLLNGNNEYLINNEDFNLYSDILKNASYFENNEKVKSHDVSANYKMIEIPVKAGLGRNAVNAKSGGKVSVINPDGEVTTSGETTFVNGSFQGIRYHRSQEFESTGRPERAHCEITGQVNFVNTSYNVIMRGEVFRKGGAFGGKSWRDSQLAWGRIDGITNGGAPSGPATDTNFYIAFNLEHTQDLTINWNYKVGYNDPTQSFVHSIVIN
ncbi:hypothetical protein [Pedobacter psychrodurus]|uniref:hypothetical protein n=1 Tax=Pedobacter psychrodurus TaxID=2530456 RepID=UPI0029306F87|nr:hypothetical protein [Pedobacter psychrodurus]